jgi:hypothetical protein
METKTDIVRPVTKEEWYAFASQPLIIVKQFPPNDQQAEWMASEAVIKNNEEVFIWLINIYKETTKWYPDSYLVWAAHTGNMKILKIAEGLGAGAYYMALYKAAIQGHLNIVEYILPKFSVCKTHHDTINSRKRFCAVGEGDPIIMAIRSAIQHAIDIDIETPEYLM